MRILSIFFAGICSILSTQGKTKRQIFSIEFTGSLLRICSNLIVKSWSDVIAKVVKSIAQFFPLERKNNKSIFIKITTIYIIICLI